MGPLAAYSIKSAILLSILFAIYMLTLGRHKYASLRRIALLCVCIASIFIPLSYSFGFRGDSMEHIVELTMPTPTVTTVPVSTSIIERIITAVIVAGIFVMTVISIIGLTRVLMLRTKTVYKQGHKFRILTEGPSTPFCFCGSIYLSEHDLDKLPEMILTHETSHASNLHFIDLFIGRILLILQWWNPLAWLFVREMQQVHEYQADNEVLNAGYDRKEYQYLLLSRAIGDTRLSLVSGFKHSELKKRLRMINREKSGKRIVIAFIIMLISASFAALALSFSPIICFINDKFSAVNLDSFQQTPVEAEVKTSDGQPHIIVDGSDIPYESIINLNQEAIESITVWKDNPEYPNGVIEIETKDGMEWASTTEGSSHELEEIKVIAYGVQKKH